MCFILLSKARSCPLQAIIDVGQNLLIPKDGRIKRMEDKDFADSTQEYVENYTPPTFIFSAPANGPAGCAASALASSVH